MNDEQNTAPAEPESIDQTEVQPEAQPEAPPVRKSVRESFEEAWAKDLDAPEDTELKADEDGPARGPDGKFVAKEKTEAEPEGEEKAEEKPEGEEKPTTHAEAPSRFSADAKSEWAKAPESVRAEAHRAIREMETGLQKKDEALKPLEPFIDMAQKSGTSLDKALQGYVNLENMLRQDPVKGLTELARNLGKSPQELGQMLAGQAESQPEGQADPRDREIRELRNELHELKQNFQGVHKTVQQQQETSVASQINEFASQHPRFDELADEMVQMLQTGYAKDLADAYEKADRINPAAPQAQPAPQSEPPAQTRKPRSLTGAPSPGSNPTSGRAPSKSPREALERAWGM